MYQIQLSANPGVPASTRNSLAIVLRRTDPASTGTPRVRVVQRLIGPGVRVATGVIPLGELDRRALADARLDILHVTADAPLGRAATVERAIP